ncbi:unnamed protein product [Sphenostylis stenocarpa]|uniref:PGG domain-containing protein n=1 Tax=Sphenostylis stenocarpa TaxID=92480 RepID=A0AA86VRY6_9FABA|nr:unnamed protein product [Sphenostylis stenocarpa]
MKKQPNSPKVKYPNNYATLCDFIVVFKSLAAVIGKFFTEKVQHYSKKAKQPEIIFETARVGFFRPKFETSKQFVKSAYVFILTLTLSGVELKEIKKTKKRHERSGQLLKALLKRPYAAYTGSGGIPTDILVEADMYNVYMEYKQGETSELGWLEEENKTEVDDENPQGMDKRWTRKTGQEAEEGKMDKKETAFLVAARNGIVEMVYELLYRIPSVIHNTNSMKENALLVAVINRQPLVVESLKKMMQFKPEIWNSLILTVDIDENTVLHLAAYAPSTDKSPQVAGSALQMMWDVKWFQYIQRLVPQHFYTRSNNRGKTPGEIFEETHQFLIEKSGDWLKQTFESCSVVAGLVAGVTFATCSTIPGGTNDQGRPHLEGKPAFNVFVIASLVGLCFSVIGLIMFLIIITSPMQSKDFRRALPFKILLGLSSLFISIAAMEDRKEDEWGGQTLEGNNQKLVERMRIPPI